jgi:hypothetical protein
MLKTAFAILLLTTAPTMAFDRTFLGTWALDAATCASADDTVRFTVTPKKLEGREIVCTLKRASPASPGWRMQYSCVGEGNGYTLDLKWHLGANGHLLEQAEGKTREYMRCGEVKATDATTLAGDFAGKYIGKVDTYEWTATIAPRGGQTYKVRVQVGSTRPACIGDIETIGRSQAGRIVTQPDQDDSCVLTISRNLDGIAVEERDCSQDHGAACTFTSRMKRVGQ